MRHPRTTIAVIGVAVSVATGGLAGASAISTPGSKYSASASTPHAVAASTLHTARAAVGGITETILVNAKGLPLYIYKGDTATRSMVGGELAALWPPVVSRAPTATGVTGKLTVVQTSNGRQVAYKGHFLYAFVEDTSGHVTGQGVQNFFVATPGISPEHASSSSGSAASSPAGSTASSSASNPYNY